MKVSITGKSENPLLKRTELSFRIEDAPAPPSRKELRDRIAALQNVKAEQVIVSKISHGFGSKEVEGKARVYASPEELEKTELPYIIGRNKGVKKGKETKEKAPEEKSGQEKSGGKAPEEKKKEEKIGENAAAEKKEEEKKPGAEKKKEGKSEEKKPEAEKKSEGKKEGE